MSVQLGTGVVVLISPLSLRNKPNIMSKSNTNVYDTYFFPYCILNCQQIEDTGYCFWMTALTLSWRHLFCSWVSAPVHCPLSKLLLKTVSGEKIFCQQFIASLQLRIDGPSMGRYFAPSASFCVLKTKLHPLKPKQFTFFEIKTDTFWRHFSQYIQ